MSSIGLKALKGQLTINEEIVNEGANLDLNRSYSFWIGYLTGLIDGGCETVEDEDSLDSINSLVEELEGYAWERRLAGSNL